MLKHIIAFLFCGLIHCLLGQDVLIYGKVSDYKTGLPLPFAKIQFAKSKNAALADSSGNYRIKYSQRHDYDSIIVSYTGYTIKYQVISLAQSSHSVDIEINIDFQLKSLFMDFKEITIKAPGELPSTILLRKVIANKEKNNRSKLDAYEYDLYNKIQFDLNNIEEDFIAKKPVQKLDLIYDYLDTTEKGNRFLPLILSETVSRFYYRSTPKIRREIIKATRTTGVENLQVNQFLGDMYLELNIYDNIYTIFGKSFNSPLSNNCQTHYKYYLEDSAFIDNDWCYMLRFVPKRDRDLSFSGNLWIHDTSFAVKRIEANVSPNANLNFVKDFYFRHDFDQVENTWMLNQERFIADIKLTKKSKVYGFYARKYSRRSDFKINDRKKAKFYNTDNTVEIMEGANDKTEEEWIGLRHVPLNQQEKGIGQMIDSLNQTPYFKRLKNLTYLAATGYHPMGIIEIGDLYSIFSVNPVERFRTAVSLRTSNNFSKRIEFGIKGAYGFGDREFKYGATIRCNMSKKKRNLLTLFYNYDIEQIGVSPYAVSMGNTFATVLSTAPFDKLTFVKRIGGNIEKDIKKDFVVFVGAEWKEYQPLGIANYLRINPESGQFDTISKIKTSELTARLRWSRNEEFISGAFDRKSLRSKFPVLSIQGIFGFKGIMGSQYNYQKIEIQLEHKTQLGIFGRFFYGAKTGYIFGNAAYPLLNAHPGNQSLWLMTSAFNKLNFLEFVSDQYMEAFIENHWDGFLFNKIPLIKKLNLRLVSSSKMAYGRLSSRHQSSMIYPSFIRSFNNIPYIESTVGIENIFKFIRVDLVWRMTHNPPGAHPLGVRARLALNF